MSNNLKLWCRLRFICNILITEITQMVDMELLDLPDSMVFKGYPYFTIRRYNKGNCSAWRAQSGQCLLGKLLWLSTGWFSYCRYCAHCISINYCNCFCICNGKTQLPEEIEDIFLDDPSKLWNIILVIACILMNLHTNTCIYLILCMWFVSIKKWK